MYEIGKTYETPKGLIKILAKVKGHVLPNGKYRRTRCIIQFVETGTVVSVQTKHLKNGNIKDYMKPSVYGVGFIGSPIKIPDRNPSNIIHRIYKLWSHMLERVYRIQDRPTYKECTVDPRWHNFTTFLNTISDVEGYEKWEQNPGVYQLDKDIKKGPCKIYSRDYCKFVTASENSLDANKRRWSKRSELALTKETTSGGSTEQ